MRRTRVVAVALLAGLAAAVAGRADVSVSNTAVNVLAQNGFGNYRNSYSWSMAWFKGKLYVGTGRQEACVEDLTVDYYLVVSGRYKTNPLPATHCPRNPNNMDLRAQIWQYTPHTGRWRMVYQSPVERNPRAKGHRYIARDIAYRGMVVYKGRLVVGDVTPNEFNPQLAQRHPPVLLVTSDGRHFSAIPATGVIERTPHGVQRPMGFRSLTVWHDRLYMTMTPTITGDGTVFELERPFGHRPTFRQVLPPWLDVFEIQVYNGSLYIGTGSRTTGYGVYRLSGRFPSSRARGRSARVHYHITPVVTYGAGRGPEITSVVSMHVFHNWLYVGASGWYNPQNTPFTEMIRINPRGHWDVVAGITRRAEGKVKAPLSGLGDGFYNTFTAHFWRMTTFHGALLVGTNDWSWLVQKAYPGLNPPWMAGIIQSALSGEFGFDMWASCNGIDFFPVTRDAFGNMYDFGARDLVTTPGGLFIGSANQAQGTKVWNMQVSPCQSFVPRTLVNGTRGPALATPQAVFTDSQRAGTVISWNRSAGATRYEVTRASYLNIPLTVAPPIIMPNGFAPENEDPDIVRPGTPGATQDEIPVPQAFVPVGTTTSTYFVDRHASPGRRYLYQVIALGAAGRRSAASAVQSAPDPRPTPTFQQVVSALPPKLTSFGSIMPAYATSRVHHDRAGMLRVLTRLLRSVGATSDTGILIQRLERRIEYAGLAGGGGS